MLALVSLVMFVVLIGCGGSEGRPTTAPLPSPTPDIEGTVVGRVEATAMATLAPFPTATPDTALGRA